VFTHTIGRTIDERLTPMSIRIRNARAGKPRKTLAHIRMAVGRNTGVASVTGGKNWNIIL